MRIKAGKAVYFPVRIAALPRLDDGARAEGGDVAEAHIRLRGERVRARLLLHLLYDMIFGLLFILA